MNTLRKISLALGTAAFCICCLFMNTAGGIGMIMNDYETAGTCLIVSTVLLAIALVLAFIRKTAANIISVLFNIAGTIFYIIPIGILNGIPDTKVPKESIELFTSRIYPAVTVTVFIAVAVFADVFSEERIRLRSEKKAKKTAEKNRALTDEEKII